MMTYCSLQTKSLLYYIKVYFLLLMVLLCSVYVPAHASYLLLRHVRRRHDHTDPPLTRAMVVEALIRIAKEQIILRTILRNKIATAAA